MQADDAGNLEQSCASLPYGDGETCGPAPTENLYTGKERDAESGNDYFGYRYYASTMGRWLSPDPGPISRNHLANPQKWNKYNYTLNNPLRFFDPDGQVERDVQLRAFIQQKTVSDPLGRHFSGDNRGFTSSQSVTYRTSITVRIETDPSIRPGNPIISVTQPGTAGTTHEVDSNGNVVKTGRATTGLPTVTGTRDANGNPVLSFSQDTKNPLEPQAVTPGISENLNVTIGQNVNWVDVNGQLSASPSFELNVGGDNIPLNSELPGASFGLGLIAPDIPIQQFTPLPPSPPPPPPQDRQ